MKTSELRKKTCCFTGHRDLPTQLKQVISERTTNEIRKLIVHDGVCFFGVGGAIGYDTLVAKVLFQLREKEFPNIKIILVYPFKGFTSRWTAAQREEYKELLPQYDKIVCVSDIANKDAYLARDRHLVDNSAYCICYCTRNYGGTAYTVKYAKWKGLEVRNVSG